MDRAVRERDASYDGIFFTAVRTTGIFCRPSCPARTPLPKNREYFASAAQAALAGYRPCKRCRPLEVDGRPPPWVADLLEQVHAASGGRVSDKQLRSQGIDPARARRYFLEHYGMTFQAYCRGRRLGEALQQIHDGAGLDAVTLGNGYESHSGFREAFSRTFGQPPGRGRSAGAVLVDWAESPLGPLVLGVTDRGVCLLEFAEPNRLNGQLVRLRRRFAAPIVPGRHDLLAQLKDELRRYFAGTLRAFRVPLHYPGTAFQRRVWEGLLQIPYGETRSYEALAEAVGCRGAQRAVGRANGQNAVSIVIPCHRVVNKGGKLGGYGGGLWRKRFLLDLEQGQRLLQTASGSPELIASNMG
jgi:AraC family transcriptional regulator of adaptative response/methylated-DNA-[protein]-cysteine methyltransferase